MQIRALRLQDVDYGSQWDDEIEDRWEYDDFRADSAWREGWISMDSVYHNAEDDRVYLGITSFNADIFRAYDRETERSRIWGTAGWPIRSTPSFTGRW